LACHLSFSIFPVHAAGQDRRATLIFFLEGGGDQQNITISDQIAINILAKSIFFLENLNISRFFFSRYHFSLRFLWGKILVALKYKKLKILLTCDIFQLIKAEVRRAG